MLLDLTDRALSADQGSGTALVEGIGHADTLGMTLEKASGASEPIHAPSRSSDRIAGPTA